MKQEFLSEKHKVAINADVSLRAEYLLKSLGFVSEQDIQAEEAYQLRLQRARELQSKKIKPESPITRIEIVREGIQEELNNDEIVRNVQLFFPDVKDNQIKYQILTEKEKKNV